MCKLGKILIFPSSFLAFFEEMVYNKLVWVSLQKARSRYIIHFLEGKIKVFCPCLRKKEKNKRAEKTVKYDFKRNLLVEKI